MRSVIVDTSTVTGIGERINPYVEMPALNKLGFTYDSTTDTLVAPEGWSFESINNNSGVIRHGDVVRGGWNYGRLELLCRHQVTYEKPDYFDGNIWYQSRVKDVLTGDVISPVFKATASQFRMPGDDQDHQKAHNDAYAWLKEHFPKTHDPTAYWDE